MRMQTDSICSYLWYSVHLIGVCNVIKSDWIALKMAIITTDAIRMTTVIVVVCPEV